MHGKPLTLVMCLCLLAALLPLASFPALIPTLAAEWRISNTEAGWISGIYYVGYMLAVPFLMSATDRIDARLVYLAGTAISAATAFAFALLVEGFWSALLWRFLAGIGLAGTYIPGLRVLTDRIGGRQSSRHVAAYISNFSVGSGLSFLLAGWVADTQGWRLAFTAAGLGPAAAFLVAALALRAAWPAERPTIGLLRALGRAVGDRVVLGYILAYATHNFEALAMRGWVVTLLASAAARPGAARLPLSPTEIATLLTVIGLPGTLLGNELAIRIGRVRAIRLIMLASAAAAVLVGLGADAPYPLLVAVTLLHGIVIPADAGAIVAGTVQAAAPALQGASMALQASTGFGASFLGPLAVGIVLDSMGGAGNPRSWLAAFLMIAAVAALGPLALGLSKVSVEREERSAGTGHSIPVGRDVKPRGDQP